mmetsp:Transcript_132346/g.423479  ORF Transcript_132346/g.423479 Transcript_132346/m.423479 type:complete len:401 (+) Transcript_132346:224-1426(+)
MSLCRPTHSTTGQAAAMMLLIWAGLARSSKSCTTKTLSATGLDAQLAMFAKSAFLVIGTHMSRAFDRNARAAWKVFRGFMALPSVITMTTLCASALPERSSASALANAAETKLVFFGQISLETPSANAVVPVVKWLTQAKPQSVSKSTVPKFSVHFWYFSQESGPLNMSTAICAVSAPASKAFTRAAPAFRTCSKPASPMLPLPSRTSTTSSLALHCKMPPFFGWHSSLLHFLYSRRLLASSPTQRPWPLAFCATWRSRTWNPPLQALEQGDQPVQPANLQSSSQASSPQLVLSVVESQGRPPPEGCCRVERTRSMMPPPHWALHALQPLHSSTTQSTGQVCSLHLRFMARGGHALPKLDGTTMERTSFCTPPPHSALHSSAIQADTSQSWMKGLCDSIL